MDHIQIAQWVSQIEKLKHNGQLIISGIRDDITKRHATYLLIDPKSTASKLVVCFYGAVIELEVEVCFSNRVNAGGIKAYLLSDGEPVTRKPLREVNVEFDDLGNVNGTDLIHEFTPKYATALIKKLYNTALLRP